MTGNRQHAPDLQAKRALKHGGAIAARKLSTGEDFTGLALEAQREIDAEIEKDGIPAVFRRRVERVQAAADLYWQAICGSKDMEKLDCFMQRWAWLQGSALRNLVLLHDLEKERGRIDAGTVLDALKGGEDDKPA